MCEMNNELQEQLWKEACSFIENSSRKHLAKLGVTLEGSDNQYLEMAFTCPTTDEEYCDFVAILDNEFLQTIRFEYPSVKIQEFPSDIALQVNYDDTNGSILSNLVLETLKHLYLTNSNTGSANMTK